jgi:hypothetical protein
VLSVGTIAVIIGIAVGALILILMCLRLVTAISGVTGRLAGDDRFHEISKRRAPSNAHITVYWHFRADPVRFTELEENVQQRFIAWTETQPYFSVDVPAWKPVLAIAGVPIDSGLADSHAAILRAFRQRLAPHLPVQLVTFPGPSVVGLTFDHTMVSGLTFARCMAHTFGDPENKAARAFPTAWYAPVVSELALLWYLGRVARWFRRWKALPTLPTQEGVSPEALFYNFNTQTLKASALAEDPSRPPSSLALIAAKTLRSLLRSMRDTLDRPLRVGFSVAFSHSKILHNNVGLIVIKIPAKCADMSLSEMARLVTRRVGQEKLQAWHSNNFLKTIPRLPSKSYRLGVDVVFTAYPSPPADLFEREEVESIRVEVRELTYPLYVNCISYLERCFVSLVINTPAVDATILRAEHADATGTLGEVDHILQPQDADSYRDLLDL